MHPAAYGFVAECCATIGEELRDCRVVDIGGAVWGDDLPVFELFTPWAPRWWVVCDPRGGITRGPYPFPITVLPLRAEEIEGAAATITVPVDVVVCTEVLEHTEPAPVFRAAAALLRTGGQLVVTCAGPSRPRHPMNGSTWQAGERYRGIGAAELLELGTAHGFTTQLGPLERADDTYALFRRGAGGRA